MREEVEKMIEELQSILDELSKVEAGSYGFKSAAPRARKTLMEVSKGLKDVRTKVQEVKKSHEEK